jgi:selenide, water dikinase
MTVDMERRKKVMERSIRLGRCVCNSRKPCPCDVFKEYNVCTCAGEKKPVGAVRPPLTSLVGKPGCSSKIGQADLFRILKNLPAPADPNVLVGMAAGDDAGVYRLGDGSLLVQTVDVFTPCVDSPYLFGRIAAANSVSDVYAMGGRPVTALSIIGFPIDELDGAIMEEILRGGIDTLDEAGCSLIGGHSINDAEIKCGFAVTGLIDEGREVARDTVAEGDVLVLTKPLGTGIVCFGAQIGRIGGTCIDEAGASMAELNRDAAELMLKYGAHACTDITGFGLAGHLVEMVRKSGLNAEIDMSRIPVFFAVDACLKNDILPGAVERNREYSMAWVVVESDDGGGTMPILYDPQTSGGLLVALPGDAVGKYVGEMRDSGHSAASIIGRIVRPRNGAPEGRVVITNTNLGNFFGAKEGVIMNEGMKTAPGNEKSAAVRESGPSDQERCCESPPEGEHAPSGSLDAFMEFTRLANGGGVIDSRSKKLMAIALSVAQRCRPCLVAHMKSALAMGITKAEIEEAASLAISFSGSPALMLYREVCGEIYG